jgi:hypothetical protein
LKKVIISLTLIFLVSCFANSWTSKMHQRIVAEASKLTPYELKLLLKHYKEDLLRGAISPLGTKKGPDHFLLVDGSYGTAHETIKKEIDFIFENIKSKKLNLDELCFRLGRISHFIAEVNNPILTGDLKREGSWFYTDFVNYTDRNLDKFVLTFDGYKHPLLEKKDYEGFIISSAIRSAKLFKPLNHTYVQQRKTGVYNFDDKSIPFATASLSYNYAITDTAKLWYCIWKSISGDTSFAPYSYLDEGKK